MIVITFKQNNQYVNFGEKVEFEANGYYMIPEKRIVYPNDLYNYYEVDEIPEGVEFDKYCYTVEDGFYENPTWTEPNKYNISDETYNQIIDDYTLSLIEEGVL